MSSALRIVAVIIGVVLLLIAAVAVYVLNLDAERFRATLSDQLRERTGLDVRLDGPITWSVWPAIALDVREVRADWTDAGTEPLAAIRRTELRAALWPLLSTDPQLEVASIVVEGVRLDLRVDADGGDNWSGPETDTEPAPAEESDAAPFSLASLRVSDLDLRYRDASSDADLRIAGLEATVLGVGEDGPIRADFSGAFAMADGASGDFDGRVEATLASGRILIPGIDGQLRMADTADALPVRIEGELVLPPEEDRLDLSRLALRLDGLAANLSGTVTELSSSPTLDLQLEVPDADPRPTLERLGMNPGFSDASALSRVGATLTTKGPLDAIALAPLALRIDGMTLRGRASYASAARTRIDFDLEADQLDLRPYSATAAPPTDADAALFDDTPFELDSLQSLDATGTLRTGGLLLPDLTLGPTRATVDLKAGRLTARVSADRLYGGSLDANLALDVTTAPPRFSVDLDGAGIRAAELAPKLGFVGPLALKGRIEARGATTAALARSAQGTVHLEGATGTLDATPVKTGMLQVARLLEHGERIERWPDRLSYRELRGDWRLVDGLGDQTLKLRVDNLELDAEGGLAPDTGVFDFRIGATFLKILAEQAIARTFDVDPDLEGIRWPLRCLGSLGDDANPCGLDQAAAGDLIAQVLRTEAGAPVRAKLEKELEQRLPEELRAPAQELLQGLFGRKATPAPQAGTDAEATPNP
jgi:AsmA protein